jgi:ferritin-like metal-binding protein YciE
MESLESLHDLFIEELKDLYSAEQQLVTALPTLAKAANSESLRDLFKDHLKQTKEQVKRLEKLFKSMKAEIEEDNESCEAMEGLIAEAEQTLERDADPAVVDAALIVAAQKVEHYEIAGYGSVRTFAKVLGYDEAARVLQTTLNEEASTDEKLTKLAEKINVKAEVADEADV